MLYPKGSEGAMLPKYSHGLIHAILGHVGQAFTNTASERNVKHPPPNKILWIPQTNQTGQSIPAHQTNCPRSERSQVKTKTKGQSRGKRSIPYWLSIWKRQHSQEKITVVPRQNLDLNNSFKMHFKHACMCKRICKPTGRYSMLVGPAPEKAGPSEKHWCTHVTVKTINVKTGFFLFYFLMKNDFLNFFIFLTLLQLAKMCTSVY